MRRRYSFLLLLSVVSLFYLSCQKENSPHKVSQSIDPDQTLIAKANAFFNTELNKESNTLYQSTSQISLPSHKTVLWDKAHVEQFSTGKVVIAPIEFDESVYASYKQSNKSQRKFSITPQLITFTDRNGNQHAQVVVKIPDVNYKPAPGKGFIGLVLVKDWGMNDQKVYKFGENSVSQIIAPQGAVTSPVKGKPDAEIATNSYTTVCSTIEWDVYVGGEYSYSYSQNLGCSTYYIPDPTIPDYEGFPPPGDYGGGGEFSLPLPEGFSAESGLSCESFNFTKISPTSNWQESGVKGLQLVGDWFGVFGGFSVKTYGNVYVGIPVTKANGVTISPGEAAELAAKAANDAAAFQQAKYFGMLRPQFDAIPNTTIAAEFRTLMTGFLSDAVGAACTVTRNPSGANTPLNNAKWKGGFGPNPSCR